MVDTDVIVADIECLTVFRAVKKNPVIRSLGTLLRLLQGPDPDAGKVQKAWACFMSALIAQGLNYSLYSTVAYLTLGDENPFTLAAEFQGASDLNPVLVAAAANDLARLGRIASLDPGALAITAAKMVAANSRKAMEAEGRAFKACVTEASVTEKIINTVFPPGSPWDADMPGFCEYLFRSGAGEMGFHLFFCWVPSCGLKPVLNPDTVSLADLTGYEDQRSVVVSNTLRFLDGKSANNLLLYGDRGTGKSATVKAVCREYSGRGLRLLEVRKENLKDLPVILERLGRRKLKFIIFIDDLSFDAVNESFMELKALLEGGVETRPSNTVVYATSNRRHLVKERRQDRGELGRFSEGGEVREFDAMQEQLSLADRFGVTVIYSSPGQDDYLKIAEYIACLRLLLENAGEEERRVFRENAMRWERWFNGRSPRTAVQYVDWVEGGGGFPWE